MYQVLDFLDNYNIMIKLKKIFKDMCNYKKHVVQGINK
jgi:hypothetical protein